MSHNKPAQHEEKESENKDIVETPVKRGFHGVFKLSPLVAFISVIFMYFAAQVLAIALIAGVGAWQGKRGEALTDWFGGSLQLQATLLILIVAIVMIFVQLLLRATNTTWKQIGLGKLKPVHFGQALIGYGWYFLLFLFSSTLVSEFVRSVDLNQQQQLGFDLGATGPALVVIGVCLVIIPAFYEEVLMRGVLFTGLRSKLSFPATLIIVSLLFGAAHLEWGSGEALNFAAAIDTIALSAVLVYLREKSKSLWPAIILHGIKNLVAFTILFVFKRGGL